jgi:hypothetical protein
MSLRLLRRRRQVEQVRLWSEYRFLEALAPNTTVSGDNLRMALTASGVPIDGPLAPALAAVQTVAKNNDHITITNNQEVEVTLGGTRTRVKEELSFDVAPTAGLTALNNIQGLQAHKMIWISIQKIELIQNQGRSSVRDSGRCDKRCSARLTRGLQVRRTRKRLSAQSFCCR